MYDQLKLRHYFLMAYESSKKYNHMKFLKNQAVRNSVLSPLNATIIVVLRLALLKLSLLFLLLF